jgi:hypothetical protein
MKFGGLTLSSHTVTIWDTTKSWKHAIDYLTSFDRSVAANPLRRHRRCSSSSTFPIPADPQCPGSSFLDTFCLE